MSMWNNPLHMPFYGILWISLYFRRIQCDFKWLTICFLPAPFYGFRPKTVRFSNQERTVSEPKTYGFGTETMYGFRTKNIRFWDGNHKKEASAKIIQPSLEVKCIGVYLNASPSTEQQHHIQHRDHDSDSIEHEGAPTGIDVLPHYTARRSKPYLKKDGERKLHA